MKVNLIRVAALGLLLLAASVGCAAAADYRVKGPEMSRGLVTYVITSDYQEKPCRV